MGKSKNEQELDKIYLMKKLSDWMFQSKENYDAVMLFGKDCCEAYYVEMMKSSFKFLGIGALACAGIWIFNFILEKKTEKDLEKSFPDEEDDDE